MLNLREKVGVMNLKEEMKKSLTWPVSLTWFFVTAGDGNFIYSQADENQKGKVARLVSPVVYSQNSAHCMTFWYHMSGSHVGTLRVKLHYQKPEEYDQLVWMAIGHQGDHWKEGRVLLHKSLKLYQVCGLPWVGGQLLLGDRRWA